MRIAIASVAWIPPEFRDDERLLEALRRQGAAASAEAWDDADVDWSGFDLVVIRSTWDYANRLEEFLAWAEGVGARLQNVPALIRWNTDKRYLRDLAAAGFPVVATEFVEPGAAPPRLEGEVVVKPAVGAGARDTGRFGPDAHGGARDLLARLAAGGRTAMVQPYLPAVDERGETAIVFFDGAPSHALRKRAVLRADEVAPTRQDELGAAEVMYDPQLVTAGSASPAELEIAAEIVSEVGARFDGPPLYARVDLVADEDGAPVLLELEAVEPNLYLSEAPGSAEQLAAAIVRRAP